VAALRRGGLDAPMVLDGLMTGQALLAYVEQVLIPTLHPDDIVVMDNLPPQNRRSSCRNRRRRCPALPAAALFARHEPDRDGLRQAQDAASARCRSGLATASGERQAFEQAARIYRARNPGVSNETARSAVAIIISSRP
jgi:hypothetical protein